MRFSLWSPARSNRRVFLALLAVLGVALLGVAAFDDAGRYHVDVENTADRPQDVTVTVFADDEAVARTVHLAPGESARVYEWRRRPSGADPLAVRIEGANATVEVAFPADGCEGRESAPGLTVTYDGC